MEKKDVPGRLNLAERQACLQTLRAGATKHKSDRDLLDRFAKAAEFLCPEHVEMMMHDDNCPRFYRQGQITDGTPGHVIYWVQSSGDYRQHPADLDHAEPPFYRVRIGANGDNHDCDCMDMRIGKAPAQYKAENPKDHPGAPVLNGKHLCKHVIIAITLEWLRDNPVAVPEPARIPSRTEVMAQGMPVTHPSAGKIDKISQKDLEDPTNRARFIKNPQEFIDAVASMA